MRRSTPCNLTAVEKTIINRFFKNYAQLVPATRAIVYKIVNVYAAEHSVQSDRRGKASGSALSFPFLVNEGINSLTSLYLYIIKNLFCPAFFIDFSATAAG